jgi:predicted nucleic acid-binding protein
MSLKVLLDTNIVVHREASSAVNEDIGILFKWLDDLHHTKCIHPVTAQELLSHGDPKTRRTLEIKLGNYHVLQTVAPLATDVQALSGKVDRSDNDRNDTAILNELYSDRVDILITEDRQMLAKAGLLGLADRTFTIDAYLEKVNAENPGLKDYRVLAVRRVVLGSLDIADGFFDSLREDYRGFGRWFNKKADEQVYVCRSDNRLSAVLYLKVEGPGTDYSDIVPAFRPGKRLKIGTFKVDLNGFRIGERFLKIVFDNALQTGVDEIYTTLFTQRIEQQRLVSLLLDFGFAHHGQKTSDGRIEEVYVRDFAPRASRDVPCLSYPFMSAAARAFMVPIYPDYHTELFPDSILRTESPADFEENDPHRNAIRKVYISRSVERELASGDIIVFYRTGGYHKSVVTTLGVVESVVTDIRSEADFIRLCRKRSVFSDKELSEHWNYRRYSRPFIVNFLYAYSLPKRPNLKRLIDLGIIADIESAPRGFTRLSSKDLSLILEESQADGRIVVNQA